MLIVTLDSDVLMGILFLVLFMHENVGINSGQNLCFIFSCLFLMVIFQYPASSEIYGGFLAHLAYQPKSHTLFIVVVGVIIVDISIGIICAHLS